MITSLGPPRDHRSGPVETHLHHDQRGYRQILTRAILIGDAISGEIRLWESLSEPRHLTWPQASLTGANRCPNMTQARPGIDRETLWSVGEPTDHRNTDTEYLLPSNSTLLTSTTTSLSTELTNSSIHGGVTINSSLHIFRSF